MHKIKTLTILFAGALLALPALAGTTPLPTTFAGSTTDYLVFNGSSFPGQNLICFSAGCGGGFQATVYGPGSTTATGPSTFTTVWCSDYQLDVTTDSQYITNITTLNDITAPTDNNVRYGNLTSVSPTGTPAGWANSVTDPTNLDGGGATAENSAAYRYTLAAALVSQYVDSSNTPDPVNLNGGSGINQALQEAVWYITYNSDYQSGATWPPSGQGISAPVACTGSNNVNTNYMCWVQYAEANANTVNTSAWAVASGPTNASGTLTTPPPIVDGYPSYQTFLVQVNSGGVVTTGDNPPTPEPAYFALTAGLGGLIVFMRRRRTQKLQS